MISVTGSRASWIALVAVVYERSGGSGAWVSAALITQFGVFALSAPWAGALGDTFDRRIVMIASDLTAAGVFVAFAFAHSPIVLVALSAVAALAEAPFGPASSAFLVMLVPESERSWATATRASGSAAGIFIGGIVGGVVVAWLGGPTAFLLNSASFVVSALLVLSIRGTFKAESHTDTRHVGVWAGVRFVSRSPTLRLLVGATGVAFVGYGMINVAEYPLFEKLGSDALGFGIATAGYGVGQFVGSRAARGLDGPHQEKRRLMYGWLGGGLSILACGIIPSTATVIALFTIAGVAESGANVASSLITQRHTPDPVRARVFAATGAVTMGSVEVAMIVGGALVGLIGPAALCVLCGAVTLLAVLPSSRVPPRGRQPLRPDAQPTGEPLPRHRWLLAT
jgi:MFS family permease